jgi:hypothetical protein
VDKERFEKALGKIAKVKARMSATDHIPIYVFRAPNFASADDTVVSAAPLEAVVRVYGGGGTKDTGGLSAAFGGVAVFKDDAAGIVHLGVWGARKAAKFREALRQSGANIQIIKAPPPGRLAWYETK